LDPLVQIVVVKGELSGFLLVEDSSDRREQCIESVGSNNDLVSSEIATADSEIKHWIRDYPFPSFDAVVFSEGLFKFYWIPDAPATPENGKIGFFNSFA